MPANNDFQIKNGLIVNNYFFVNSGKVTVGNTIVTNNDFSVVVNGAYTVVNSSSVYLYNTGGNAAILRTDVLFLGNNTVNVQINTSSVSINGAQLLPLTADIMVNLGDGVNVINTGAIGNYIGPFDFKYQILGYSAICKTTAGIGIDLLKTTYANFPTPTATIADYNTIYISGTQKNQNLAMTSATINVGEILIVNVNYSNVNQANFVFKIKKLS